MHFDPILSVLGRIKGVLKRVQDVIGCCECVEIVRL